MSGGAENATPRGPLDPPTATVDGLHSAAEASPGMRRGRGASVGRYVVLREVGAGGMGVVYAAYDPDLDRHVALKLLPAGGPAAARPGLLREAQALARLSHANVLTIYDAGTSGNAVYLAMELVDGETLGQWSRRRRRAPRELLRVFAAAGRGLAAAHHAGIVHGDFKPANVMVAADGRVLVVDFGLARAARPRDGEGSVVGLDELDGRRVAEPTAAPTPGAGTPSYMAPEQRAGEAPDAASDQYAFCVALAEVLRARDGESAADAAAGDWPRGVPPRVRRAIERGLRRRPEDRHPTMDALLAVLGDDPWRRRRRVGLGLALAGALVAAGLPAFLASEHGRIDCATPDPAMAAVWSPERSAALGRAFAASGSPLAASGHAAAVRALDGYVAEWGAMRRSACESTHRAGTQSARLLDLRMSCLDTRRDELTELLRLVAGGDVDPGVALEAFHDLVPLSRCADTRTLLSPVPPPAAGDAPRVAAGRRRLATVAAHERLGRYAAGVELVREVVADAEAVGYWPLVAEALLAQGILEERTSDADATATLDRAVDAAIAGGADRTAAEALVRLVRAHGFQQADHERARYYGRLATAALGRLGEPAELAADLADHLGRLAFQESRLDEALELHGRALELRRRALGESHPEVGTTLLRLAAVHSERGELDAAGRLASDAVALYRSGYGDLHPRLAAGLVTLGDVHYRHGDLTAAEEAQRRALAVRTATLGARHVQTADVQLRLANTLLGAERTEEALELLSPVAAVIAEALADTHPRMADVHSSLGSVHLARAEHDLAVAAYERALAIQERVYGPRHPWVANTRYNLGLVEKAAGRFATARGHFARCLADWEEAYGAEHHLVAHALTALGQSLVGVGDPTAATVALERALGIREAGDTDPALVASTRFSLARALAAAGVTGDRPTTLARAALRGFAAAGDEAGHAEVRAWLDPRGGST